MGTFLTTMGRRRRAGPKPDGFLGWERCRIEMRGAPRESATLFNMVDGVFAVAITLSPTALPERLRHSATNHLLVVTTSLLLIALTMLLLWLKLRTIVQLKERLKSLDIACIAVILMVAVMIPQSGYLAIQSGHLEGNLWNWSRSQWANIEYQGLLLLVEGALLILSVRMMQSPRARLYPRSLRRWVLGSECVGLLALTILVTADNLLPNINGLYIYAIPIILLIEEWLCMLRMKVFERSRASLKSANDADNRSASSHDASSAPAP
jgi:uncharacterized membrane protein